MDVLGKELIIGAIISDAFCHLGEAVAYDPVDHTIYIVNGEKWICSIDWGNGASEIISDFSTKYENTIMKRALALCDLNDA